jgi:hypothetical protein
LATYPVFFKKNLRPNEAKQIVVKYIYQMAAHYTSWPKNIPNGNKLTGNFQIISKIEIFGMQIFMPSGNPVREACNRLQCKTHPKVLINISSISSPRPTSDLESV